MCEANLDINEQELVNLMHNAPEVYLLAIKRLLEVLIACGDLSEAYDAANEILTQNGYTPIDFPTAEVEV